jgi:hypothetical protein
VRTSKATSQQDSAAGPTTPLCDPGEDMLKRTFSSTLSLTVSASGVDLDAIDQLPSAGVAGGDDMTEAERERLSPSAMTESARFLWAVAKGSPAETAAWDEFLEECLGSVGPDQRLTRAMYAPSYQSEPPALKLRCCVNGKQKQSKRSGSVSCASFPAATTFAACRNTDS